MTTALVEKVLGIAVATADKLPAELQRTLESKPDQLLRITDRAGEVFLLHLEFQVVDEPQMAARMLEYRALLGRKHNVPVRQHVLFLSDRVPEMETRIEQNNLAFDLIRFSELDHRFFLSSADGDEVVFAVLANFGDMPPADAASRIVERLTKTSAGPAELARHLEQLRVVANLRNLNIFIEQIMEAITKYIKPEDDYFFRKGEAKGETKGEARGAEKKARQFVASLLQKKAHTPEQIADLAGVPVALVMRIKEELGR